MKSLAIDKENATGTAFYHGKPVCLPFACVLYSGSSLKKKFSTYDRSQSTLNQLMYPSLMPYARIALK